MDANDGCFGPTDKSRERSRAPCPPALVLHAERKSPAGEGEDKVGGCEMQNPRLGALGARTHFYPFPTSQQGHFAVPLWYQATASWTAAEPSRRKGRLGAKQEQPGLPVCVQSGAHWQAVLRGAWVVTLDSHVYRPPSQKACTHRRPVCAVGHRLGETVICTCFHCYRKTSARLCFLNTESQVFPNKEAFYRLTKNMLSAFLFP